MAAAKAAAEVAGLVRRNNRIGNLIVEEAFNLWTDGKVGAYVRFVVDGQRFGFHPETEIGAREVRLGDKRVRVPGLRRRKPGERGGCAAKWFCRGTTCRAGCSIALVKRHAIVLSRMVLSVVPRKAETGANGDAPPSSIAGRSSATPYGENGNLNFCNIAQCRALLTEEDFVAAETITVPAAKRGCACRMGG